MISREQAKKDLMDLALLDKPLALPKKGDKDFVLGGEAFLAYREVYFDLRSEGEHILDNLLYDKVEPYELNRIV